MGWGGGVFELGNPKRREGSVSFGKFRWKQWGGGGVGGGQETVPSVGGNGFVFGITHCSLICKIIA